jgi:hypothetical protein
MKRIRFEPALRAALLCAVAAALIGPAGAADLDGKRITLRGFGTLGATTQDSDGIEFRRNFGQTHGVASGDIELYSDSIAGVQIDARLNSGIDVMAQAVTRQRTDGSWRPEVSQAFVRWSPDESLALRAGRVSYDIYLLAESRQVGYSYLAVRPSPEFYGMIANDAIDGADFAYARRVGRGLVRARVFGGDGSSGIALVDGTHSDATGSVYGASIDYIYRGWMARAAYANVGYSTDPQLRQLAAALRMTGMPQAVSMGERLDHHTLRSAGIQLGVAYDDGPVLAQALYGNAGSDSIAGPEADKFYGLFGYRVQHWTPFVAVATSRDRAAPHSTGLPPIPQLAPLEAGVQGIQATMRSTQHTFSLGARYDFSSHFDFKLQLDRVSIRDSALMFDRRVPPGGDAEMTVLAATVDFVF